MSPERLVRYAESGGLQIAYQVVGESPLDLVFVGDNGINLDLAQQDPRMARFTHRMSEIGRVILMDPRGVGLSDSMEHLPPLEEWVDDLRCVLDAAGSERAVLVGEGSGAQRGLIFAAIHPNRVQALVSINGYARLRRAPWYPAGMPAAVEEALLEVFSELWGTGACLQWCNPEVMSGSSGLEWWARIERATATPRRARNGYEQALDIDICDILPTLTLPVLVVQAVDDRYIRPAHGEYLASHIPGARLVEITGGHSPMLTSAQDELIELIAEFVTGAPYRPATDRALMTVAFTDLVDSTSKAAELGDHRWRSLLAVHDDVSRREVEAARGRVVKFTGDGMMATFDGPARAVECVRSISDKLEAAGLFIRAGVHTGEVEVRGDDIGGIAVHIAARVAGLAGAGETLTSSTVRDLVAGSGLVFRDRGMHALKGVPDEWRIFAVDDAGR